MATGGCAGDGCSEKVVSIESNPIENQPIL